MIMSEQSSYTKEKKRILKNKWSTCIASEDQIPPFISQFITVISIPVARSHSPSQSSCSWRDSIMKRQDTLRSSSSRRETTPDKDNRHADKTIGCMSGLFHFVYKYQRRRKFLTFGLFFSFSSLQFHLGFSILLDVGFCLSLSLSVWMLRIWNKIAFDGGFCVIVFVL